MDFEITLISADFKLRHVSVYYHLGSRIKFSIQFLSCPNYFSLENFFFLVLTQAIIGLTYLVNCWTIHSTNILWILKILALLLLSVICVKSVVNLCVDEV